MRRSLSAAVLVVASCGGVTAPEPVAFGVLEVVTTTVGDDLPRSYCLRVVSAADHFARYTTIGSNAGAVLRNVRASDDVKVDLQADGCAAASWYANCTAGPGTCPTGASQQVPVTAGDTTSVSFTVTCTAIP